MRVFARVASPISYPSRYEIREMKRLSWMNCQWQQKLQLDEIRRICHAMDMKCKFLYFILLSRVSIERIAVVGINEENFLLQQRLKSSIKPRSEACEVCWHLGIIPIFWYLTIKSRETAIMGRSFLIMTIDRVMTIVWILSNRIMQRATVTRSRFRRGTRLRKLGIPSSCVKGFRSLLNPHTAN